MQIELKSVCRWKTPGYYAKTIEDSGLILTTCYEDDCYCEPSKYYIHIKTIEDVMTLADAVGHDIIFEKKEDWREDVALVIYNDYVE